MRRVLFFVLSWALLLACPVAGLYGAEPRSPESILADLNALQKTRNAERAKLEMALQESQTRLAEAQVSLNHLATATENLTLFSQNLAQALRDSRAESETLRLWSVVGISAGAAAILLGGLAVMLK